MLLLVKGIVIGLALAVPVGPVGLLVFRRTTSHGRMAGVASGVGAAVADALLCAFVAMGLTWVSDFIATHANLLNSVGSALLIAIGVIVFRTAPPEDVLKRPRGERPGWLGTAVPSFLITITNPLTILGVTGIFAGFGAITHVANSFDATLLVSGIFLGSMVWWCALSQIGFFLRNWATGLLLRRINQGCGVILVVCGIVRLVVFLLEKKG